MSREYRPTLSVMEDTIDEIMAHLCGDVRTCRAEMVGEIGASQFRDDLNEAEAKIENAIELKARRAVTKAVKAAVAKLGHTIEDGDAVVYPSTRKAVKAACEKDKNLAKLRAKLDAAVARRDFIGSQEDIAVSDIKDVAVSLRLNARLYGPSTDLIADIQAFADRDMPGEFRKMCK